MGEDRLKQFSEIKVSEIMVPSQNIIYTTPEEKISATELLMLRKKIGGLPVLNDRRKVIGIITQRDIRLARFAMSLDDPYTLVKDLMTTEVIFCKEDDTIKEVLEKMFENKIERLPVINENKELIGLVLQQDILKKLLEYILKQ